MSEQPLPHDLVSELREMRHRLDKLERAPRLTSASITDDEGRVRVRLGRLDDAGEHFGLAVYDPNGRPVLDVDQRGLLHPFITLPAFEYAKSVESPNPGAWTPVVTVAAGYVSHDAIWWLGTVQADPGTVVEARLHATATNSYSAVINAGGGGTVEWHWAGGWDAWVAGGITSFRINLEVRRVSGAGRVFGGLPYTCVMAEADETGATPTGL